MVRLRMYGKYRSCRTKSYYTDLKAAYNLKLSPKNRHTLLNVHFECTFFYYKWSTVVNGSILALFPKLLGKKGGNAMMRTI